jgi:hypothetical protein
MFCIYLLKDSCAPQGENGYHPYFSIKYGDSKNWLQHIFVRNTLTFQNKLVANERSMSFIPIATSAN